MNTDQMRKIRPEVKAQNSGRKRMIVIIVITAIALGAAATAGIVFLGNGDTDDVDAGFAVVKRGPLTISVSQKGIVKSRNKVVVKCKVEGRNSIITLIEEGKMVKKGDLLLELDSSKLVERRDQQEITVSNAEANVKRSDGAFVITKNKAKSDTDKAELDLKFAKMDLEKYTEGDYPLQLKQAGRDIELAREEFERASNRVDGSQRLAKDGYITKTELQTDVLAKKRNRLNREMAQRKLDLLKTYTHKRDLEQFQSDVHQAEMALVRTKIKAESDVKLAELDLKNRKSQHDRQQAQLDKIIEQIGYCHVVAPVAGQVVYATTGQRRRRRDPLDVGQEVRERQELFHLPTANSMMTEIKIHESNKQKVKVGMPARITISSMPGKTFTGKLAKIAPMPDEPNWTTPNVRAFNAEIYLDNNGEKISPGVSCEASIIIKEYTDVLSVPLQSVIKVKGKSTVYVKTSDGIKPRVVELGMDNGRVVHVINGLKEDEKVSLTPPLKKATVGQGQTSVEFAPKKKPATRPAAEPKEQTPDRSNMTPEQLKKYMEKLTPEQRAKLKEQGSAAGRRGQRGDGNGRGD